VKDLELFTQQKLSMKLADYESFPTQKSYKLKTQNINLIHKKQSIYFL